jgi:DNA repair photolyase
MSAIPTQPHLFNESANAPVIGERPCVIGQTSVAYAPAREILTRATGFMDAYDFTLNPYSGCSFGCTYCYAAFFSRDVEKRDSWGYWVNVKENAVELMAKRKPGTLDGKLIYMSSVTDPYQPVERELKLTRGILEIMAERHKPKLVIQTRSPDVVRDCDLFRKIEEKGGRVQVNMTVTTDDEEIRRTFEPFCPSNPVRLRAIKEVQEAGIDTCITMTPLLLVNNNGDFADELIGTGVEKFIAQPFHFRQGKFLAGTRDGAYDLMAGKLGCGRDNFGNEYLERYREFFEVLNNRLQDNGLPPLGEGKGGFAPPF